MENFNGGLKLLYIILLFCACNTSSQTVISVHDGDTFKTSNGETVRLAEIDAPELTQAFGLAAKHFIDSMVYGRTVKLVKVGTDKYNRIVCDVYVDSVWVNKAIVDAGYAWAYKGLSKLHNSQIQARNAKKGMWVYQYNEPPFKYRRR